MNTITKRSAAHGAALLFFALFSHAVLADTQTRTTAASVTGSGWTTVTNAASIDGSCTFPSGTPGAIQMTDWGFTIPAGSTINGISVLVQGASTAGNNDIQLIQAGTAQGTTFPSAISGGSCPGSSDTVGSASELWALAWTDAGINAANFGVEYRAEFAGRQFDGVEVTVDFTPPGVDIAISSVENSADPVIAGSGADNIDYTFSVANIGSLDATGVVVDLAPATTIAGIVCTSVPSQGNVVGTVWTVGALAAGAPAVTLANQCTVPASASAGSSYSQTLTVASLDQSDGNGANDSSSQDSTVALDADLSVTKSDAPDPVIAGGANLVYTITVNNAGPSDAMNVVATETLPPNSVLAASVGCAEDPNGAPTCSLGDIAAGGSAQYTIEVAVPSSVADGMVLSNVVSVASDTPDSVPGDNSTQEDTTVIREATWDINKIWDGGEVAVQINCSDGYSDASSTSGGSASFTHTGFADGVNCVVTETVPAGFAPSYSADCDVTGVLSGSVYSCDITNATTTARFQVTKDFSDGSTDDVEVTLTCNTGLPLEQSLTIAGGDPIGVIFVVTEYIDGTMSCSVTEVTNTPGYDMDTSGCVWDNVLTADSPFSCVVNNTAQDGTFTVNKDWNIFNEDVGSEVDAKAHVEIWCDAEITNGGSYDEISENWYLSGYLGDGDSLTATVSTLTGTANCWANEQILESGVESSGDCGSRPIVAGGNSSCTFINTIFFEGIPTLSQYGLALMALLMLAVGMVGFRRFA